VSGFRYRKRSDTLTVQFTDESILDDVVIAQLGRRLIELLKRQSPKRVILDFRNVRFMSSAIIGKFVLLNKCALERRIDLRFCSVRPNLMALFKITRLHRVFKFGADDLRRSVRFAPELFEARNRVLSALANADLYWLHDFTSVEPLHDVYGIEVRGIKDPKTADRIQKLLVSLFPAWRSPL
jgi:anti-sigma B factor antagonist